jgi:hypothetical protein
MDGETSFDAKQRRKLRNVWITGRQGLTEREAASLLISDARSFIQKELGLADAKWDNKESDMLNYDSQSPSEQSIHGSQEQSPLHDKTSKCPKETANQSSTSCHLQSHPLLLEELQSKIFLSETNETPTKHERKNSSCCSLLGNKMSSLKERTRKTKTKFLLSELSDEDYVSSSPLLNCSQNKSSGRHTSQKFRSRLGKVRNSKTVSGRLAQKSSDNRTTNQSRKNILSKRSETLTASKPCSSAPINRSQSHCNRMDNTHSRKLNSSLSEEGKGEQNLLSFSFILHETSDDKLPVTNSDCNKSSSEVNQSVDYFSSPLEISESKLHEKTQQFKQNTKPKVSNEPSSENVSGKVANISNATVSNKEQHLRNFVSSLTLTDNTLNKNKAPSENTCTNDIHLSNNNVNQETEPLKKDVRDLDQKINPSSVLQYEKQEEVEKVTLTKTCNKRGSSDFFSSPVSGGKCVLDTEVDNQSPSLFGDSIVMDTQLNDMLNACCKEHETTAEGNCQNQAQDYNLKTHVDLIIQQVPYDMKDHQCLTSVYNSDIIFSKADHVKTGKEWYKPEEEPNSIRSCMCDPEILNPAKLDTENIKVSEVNSNEDEVNDKIKEKFLFKKQNQLHSLPKGIVEKSKSEILDKINSPACHDLEMEGLELPALSNIVRDSMGRKGLILHLSSCDSTDSEVSGPHSVYSEEIDFHSVAEQTTISHVKSNFKMKKGLVSPVTYHLNVKLQENLHKSNTSLKETLRRKRKTSTFSDSSDSENEFSNRKRKRISNGCEITDDENAEEVLSVFEENDNAQHWLCRKNESAFEYNKNFAPKGQCPDRQDHFPNENQGVVHVMEQILHPEKQRVNERPDPENDDPITDSFLERAFNTYWDLDTETTESKKEDKDHHDSETEKDGNCTSKTNPVQEFYAPIPPTVSNITHKCDKSETKEGVISAGSSSPSHRAGDNTKIGWKISNSPFVISNSFLEAAFNTCWEEGPEYKEIKSKADDGKQNLRSDPGSGMSLKEAHTHNNLRHQTYSFDNRGSEGQSSKKEKKRSGCERRHQRLTAAAADKENRNSREKSTEVCKPALIVKFE